MRVAVFSDVHGNPYACEAVLNAIGGEHHAIHLMLAALMVDDVAGPEFGQSQEPISVYRVDTVFY